MALSLLAAAPALAADPLFAPEPVASSGWIVTVRANVTLSPKFEGSDARTLFAYPTLSVRRAGTNPRFSAPDDGLGIALYEQPGFAVGPVVAYRPGRYTGDDRRLAGLDDVRWAIEPGVFLEFWPTDFARARVELRHGVFGHQGLVGTLGLDYVQRAGAVSFSFGPRAEFGDGRYARDVYDVTPFEAALNPFVTAYRGKSGFTSVGAVAAVTYDWTPSISTTLYGGYKRLVGSAADNPVTEAFGSRDQFNIGLRASYSFGVDW
ncbi:MipA/OmpV family protein [Salinarimonas soli]|uniref:MipA/OmpV family protein n=2 Tax=Salinarimonas soli TaxID=1638099 RepID=A0A5B2VFI6_9HYPH|nr:MipA/OmpV family protein [Salinarimonas soli]